MKVRDFLETVMNNEELFDKCLDKEVSVQMYAPNGTYLGNSYGVDFVGYSFSPFRENSGNLVLNIRIIDKQED